MINGQSGIKSTCSYCGVGCGVIAHKHSDGRVSIEGDPLHPASKGMLCSKGRNLHYVVNDKTDRILYPEMRGNKYQERTRVSWDTAMNRVSAVFKTLTEKFGPDSVAFYVSGQCLTEEYYLVNKLAKGFMGTNNIDTNSRLCMSSAVVGYKLSLGEDSVPVSYNDIELADCFFITGANPAWCHPILFRRLEKHKAENPHVKIIVADPRKTESVSLADIHLQLKPGTDVFLNNAIARSIIADGLADEEFARLYCNGYEELKKSLLALDPYELAAACDVPHELIKRAASYIGTSKGFISMWAMGLNQSAIGVNKNLSLINLSLITGKIGKPGSGPFSLTGQPNAMGGREVGGLSNLLPAHRSLDNPVHRKEVADFWDVPTVPEKPGLTATQMFEALEQDKLKAIWIICTNPLVSLPNARLVELALKKARFVVVQDISHSSVTSKYADVILPAAGWLEKEGTMTNSDRRISYLPKLVDTPGEALPDAQILQMFAKKMGFKGFDFAGPSEIFDEHCRLTKGTNIDISGLSYRYLQTHGSVQWPFRSETEGETHRLFTDFRFYTPNGKANLHAVPMENESEQPTEKYPLILTTGRIRDQWHTMTRTGKVKKLNKHIEDPFLEIHPEDAEIRGVENDQLVEIFNAFGKVRVRARITDSIKKGVVFLPMHWGKQLGNDSVRANNLTTNRMDPKSKEPDFKYSVVDVRPYVKPVQRIAIVGAGAAAYKFITSYRKYNATDEITVFSKEPVPFYNRVQLPEYISGEKKWEQLLKISEEEIKRLRIKVFTNTSIESVNRDSQTIIDAYRKSYTYDILILCTGSRANLPKGLPAVSQGIYKIRDREDADRLKSHLTVGDHVVIVGGGVLGLEAAASLSAMGVHITLVNRNARLMDKQLDRVAGELLEEIITANNIEIQQNDEIERLLPDPSGFSVTLKSGKPVKCRAIIFATGTIPNIELAANCGLNTSRGVTVNGRLETSDPSIFALGEIAEFEGQMFGITAAAEEQAEIAARYILGDVNAVYNGSVPMNILKFPGVELCSLGITVLPENDKTYEEILFIDRANRYYKKCIVHNDKLVGAILLGDKSEFREFRDLIKQQTELSERRLTLLRSGKPADPVKGKLVCSCNNVGSGNILDAIKGGITMLDQLCNHTGAGTGCGSCKPEIKALLSSHLQTEPVVIAEFQ